MGLNQNLFLIIVELAISSSTAQAAAPVFYTPNPKTASRSVVENSRAGVSIITIDATDADGDKLIYSILTQVPNSPPFELESLTGTLKTPFNLDAETSLTYNITFSVTDGKTTVDSIPFRVIIKDLNEFPPVFTAESYSTAVLDGVKSGYSVITVTATDRDATDTVTYRITSGNTGNEFTISNNGEIKTAATLTRPRYTLDIQASDGTKTANAVVTVTVNDCEPPPFIENSGNNATLDATFSEGTVIEYICDITTYAYGYPFFVCENGNWTDGSGEMNDFKCFWKTCPAPRIEHGSFKADSFTVGNFATFECDEGYKLKGSSRALCRINRRWRWLPTCEQRNVYGNHIHNSCESHCNLIGPSLQKCESDGQWTRPSPYCEEINCGDPAIGNGTAYYDQASFMSSALIECDEGAILEGEEFITCYEDGWTHAYCHAPCHIPHIENGDTDVVHLTHGQILTWQCDNGYTKTGNEDIMCQSGNLTAVPFCLAVEFGNDPACPALFLDGYNVTSFHKRCYIFITAEESFNDAKQRCERHGWRLVSIDDEREMDFLSVALGQKWTEDTWIGIQFSESHEVWTDLNGYQISYTKWLDGQ